MANVSRTRSLASLMLSLRVFRLSLISTLRFAAAISPGRATLASSFLRSFLESEAYQASYSALATASESCMYSESSLATPSESPEARSESLRWVLATESLRIVVSGNWLNMRESASLPRPAALPASIPKDCVAAMAVSSRGTHIFASTFFITRRQRYE